ncbi:hypothetical protein McaMca56_005061 [Microsporum canis]
MHEAVLTMLEAISTLLQPPVIRTGLPPHTVVHSPTSRDIPPVTLTTVPHVEPSTFNEYLSQVGILSDAFHRSKLESKDGGAQVFRQDGELAPRGKRKASVSKRGQPAMLSTIPPVYFDENFCLENPRTFGVVSEHAEVVKQPPSTTRDLNKGANGTAADGNPQPARKALTTNAILQEKLSWYMDTIEIHLISSISQASASVFAALGSLRGLQDEVANPVAKIQKLREDLAQLDKDMVARGCEIVSMKRRRNNLGKLGEATKQLQCVLSGASHCEELLASGTLNPQFGGELHRLTDLRRLHVLGGLLQGINQLRLRIREGYEARLLNILLCDLRRHVSGVPSGDTLARWVDTAKRSRGSTDVSPSKPASMMTAEKLREELIPVLQGLGQSQYLAAPGTAFREAVIREMKSLIRQHLQSSTDDDAESLASASTLASSPRPSQQEKQSILSRNLRALNPEDSEALFVRIYCGIGEALRRLNVQIKVLLDITSGMKTTQTLDMSSLLIQAVDKAESEMTKVLRVRTEQTIRLGSTDFLRYFTLNRLFVNECEAVSGHSRAALRGVVNNQIHDFIPLLHVEEKQKLAQKMESEKWEPVDFKPQDASILAHILQSMTSDPPAWLSYTDTGTAGLETAKQNKTGPTLAVIEEEEFMLVDSAAFALRGIEQYAILLASIPGMVNEISTALLDYLKLYNSRTQELILGAGARITAGLANINTKHLALASQSLSFFIALIPSL